MDEEQEKRPEDDVPQEEKTSEAETAASSPPTDDADDSPAPDVETVSLFDLLGGEDEVPPDEAKTVALPSPFVNTEPEEPEEDEEDEEETTDLGGDADDATRTVTVAPAEEERKRPSPGLPLTPDDLTPPQERPLEIDQEATVVQPRVAFPGEQGPPPLSDAPTRQYRRPTPSPEPESGEERRERSPRPRRRPVRQSTAPQPVRVAEPAEQTPPQPQSRRSWRRRTCLLRALIFLAIAGLAGLALSLAGAAIAYSMVARDLPPPGELRGRASTFETTRIYDRDGQLLYSLADPNAGNRTYVPLEDISPNLVNATVATEDARFYENPGFDPIGITRAVVQAAQEREIVSGASTITQQLVRAVLLDEEERTQRTFRRKIREIILAAEVSRTYEKNEILELYLNEIYYGNLAYGVEAAAQTYFDKSAADLTLPEASLLAGLPQAPAAWDPYTAPDKAIGRQWEVLSQMVAEGFVTLDEAQAALNETNLFIYEMNPPRVTVRFPHFTFTALDQAEDLLGVQDVYGGGLNIYTTIDPAAQQLAEEVIAASRDQIRAGGANNAAMIVLHPETAEILALVGSVDFDDESISGQVNMALQPRQPGSTIKPLVYLSAFEQGWTPATLIWDVETQFPNGPNPPYVPKNYDDEFHGPLRLRPALGNSYNIPAVKALEYVGVCAFIDNMQKLGLASLQDEGCAGEGRPRNYGLALALGGGEISPMEMAAAFAALGNGGRYQAPYAIERIEDNQGNVRYARQAPQPATAQVVQAELAYLIGHILRDNDARQPEFGQNNRLAIPGYQVAAKTGTSGTTRNDVRDAWTIGFSPRVVTAVWVGNTDNEPVGEGQSGYRLASPLWNQFMTRYLADQQPLSFQRPPGVTEMEICALSGTRPGPDCPGRMTELFAAGQPPLDAEVDFRRQVPIDLWTGNVATEACPEAVYDATFVNLLVSGREEVRDRERQNAREWLEGTAAGRAWAGAQNIALPLRLPPQNECDPNGPRPQARIDQPPGGGEIIDTVEVRGSAAAPNFTGYRVEYGLSHDPGGWGEVQEMRPAPVENGVLATWDTGDIETYGPITLRLLVFGPDNPYTDANDPVTAEARVPLTLLAPTATPTPTPTDTPTPTATPTATPTPSITPTPTEAPPTPSLTPTIPTYP